MISPLFYYQLLHRSRLNMHLQTFLIHLLHELQFIINLAIFLVKYILKEFNFSLFLMKHFLFLVLAFFTIVPSLFAESSEDAYTIEQACKLSNGLHLGKIVGLADLYNTTFPDANYGIGSFHHVTDYNLGDSLVFTVNDLGSLGEQRYSELFFVTCKVENREALHFNIFGKRTGTQYSPEVTVVNRNYLILDDWENISGKSYHVGKIFDRTKNIFYTLDDTILLKSAAIRTLVRNNQFSWTVKSYATWYATVEIRTNGKVRTFRVKIS